MEKEPTKAIFTKDPTKVFRSPKPDLGKEISRSKSEKLSEDGSITTRIKTQSFEKGTEVYIKNVLLNDRWNKRDALLFKYYPIKDAAPHLTN